MTHPLGGAVLLEYTCKNSSELIYQSSRCLPPTTERHCSFHGLSGCGIERSGSIATVSGTTSTYNRCPITTESQHGSVFVTVHDNTANQAPGTVNTFFLYNQRVIPETTPMRTKQTRNLKACKGTQLVQGHHHAVFALVDVISPPRGL